MKPPLWSLKNTLIYYKFFPLRLHHRNLHDYTAAPDTLPPLLHAAPAPAVSTYTADSIACIAHAVHRTGTLPGSTAGRDNTAYTARNNIHIFDIR